MSKKFEKKDKNFVSEKDKNFVLEEKKDEVQEDVILKEKWEIIGHGPTTTTLKNGDKYIIVNRVPNEVGEFIEI